MEVIIINSERSAFPVVVCSWFQDLDEQTKDMFLRAKYFLQMRLEEALGYNPNANVTKVLWEALLEIEERDTAAHTLVPAIIKCQVMKRWAD
jgi:hypothetical protein